MTGRPRVPRRRRSVLILAAAGLAVLVVIGIIAVTVTSPAGRTRPLRAAQSFTLGELGHPGGHVSLAGFAGRPVVLNFFASWCGPCQRETPLLARFYAQHHGRIVVIGIDSNDPKSAALKFVRAQQVSYPVAVDPFPATTATSYGVLALPQTYFLNARHRIVRHVVGGVTASELSAWARRAGAGRDEGGAGRGGG